MINIKWFFVLFFFSCLDAFFVKTLSFSASSIATGTDTAPCREWNYNRHKMCCSVLVAARDYLNKANGCYAELLMD